MLRLFIFAIFVLAIALGVRGLSIEGARAIEDVLAGRVNEGLAVLGFDWARAEADGLVVELSGNAPDPDAQALAVEASRSIARIGRVIDRTTATLAPPPRRDPARVEFHRDDGGLTLIGTVYDDRMRNALLAAIAKAEPGLAVHDLTGVGAARPGPDWDHQVNVAVAAVKTVPRAFVRIEPGTMLVEGVASDVLERDRMEGELLRLAGPNVSLTTAIRVPSRVIVPFAFRARKAPDGTVSIETCAVRNEAEAAEIEQLRMRRQIGGEAGICRVGLGGPHGDWLGAVRAALNGLDTLPAGMVEISYRSVSIEAAPPTRVESFEGALARLALDLPPGFELAGAVTAGREEERIARERESYWMRLSRLDDHLSITGRIASDPARRAVEALAAARFGRDKVTVSLEISGAAAPEGWQQATLAAIDTLAEVPGFADLTARGLTLRARVPGAAVARERHEALAARIPDGLPVRTEFTVDMPALIDALPLAPARCVAELNRTARIRQITFKPGSAQMGEANRDSVVALARTLARCPEVRVEIGGHTDNQGGEALNERLSQSRAEAVLEALAAEGVARARLVAHGYGEGEPVAPNDTPEGRALNRRIAFKLVE